MFGTRQAICVCVSFVPMVLLVTAIDPPAEPNTIRSGRSSRRIGKPSTPW
jgi:hypothetical protein